MKTPRKPLTAAQAERLTANTQPWLSCDSCFDQIDGYVDALVRGGRGLDEPLRVHLTGCPVCYGEAETLVSLAAQDQGVSQELVLEALRGDVRSPVDSSADAPPESRSMMTRLFRRRRTRESPPPHEE